MLKVLITKNSQGDILDVLTTTDTEMLIVTEQPNGGISAQLLTGEKKDKASFREAAWDALAAGIDSAAAQEYGVQLSPSTIKFLQKL